MRIFIGAAARAEGSMFGFVHWPLISQWREYEDGTILAGRVSEGKWLWEIVRQPSIR